jgi:hypothetical protein
MASRRQRSCSRSNVRVAAEDGIGDRFGGRPTVGPVHLDAEVSLRSAGVVAGGEDDAADGSLGADQVGGGGGGENAAGGGDEPGHAMGRGHAGDHADRPPIAVAAVAAHHQGAAPTPGSTRNTASMKLSR